MIRDLEAALQSKDQLNWQELGLDELIDMIIDVHHRYVLTTVPALSSYLDKLCKVHGEKHPELFEIKELFECGSAALMNHMQKEEMVLFPYIKAMVQANRNEFPLSKPHFQHIDNPIQSLINEHEGEGKRFKRIAELSNSYRSPADDCQTFKVAYAMLEAFEQDLNKHIHLENNLLFPSARSMFRKFKFSS